MVSRRSIGRVAILLAGAVAACGGDSGGNLSGGPDPAALSASRSQPSGDGQSGAAGQDLPNPLRIVVLRGAAPEAGAVVTWSTTGTGATLTPGVDTTGSDGISTSIWHLGTETGAQTSKAVVAGADGSPVQFSATAAGPGSGPGGGPAPVGIQLRSDGGNRFEPANVTISVGTTVTWTWVGGIHDVTPDGIPAFTGSGQPVSAPHTFAQTFNTPGTYLYFCTVHGTPTSGMRGTIEVR